MELLSVLLSLIVVGYFLFVFLLPFVVIRIFRRLGALEGRLERLEFDVAAMGGREKPAAQAVTRTEPEPALELDSAAAAELEAAAVPSPPPAAPPEPAPESIRAPTPPETHKPSAPRLVPLRTRLAGEEGWEVVIGGSWMNKLGVLVLVIGISLFLGYSLRYFGPAGRVMIGLAASASMLLAGVVLERRKGFLIYARGLIGGGWAAFYFTAYAMYGLEAARVIHDPLTGIMVLGAVAIGIILHSLRYRSELVTGLAYFVAYFTLVISPVSSFAVFASVPLTASLLVVAFRFSWYGMTAGGLIATYGVYALRHGLGFPPVSEQFAGIDIIYATLVIAWILFEAFDLFDLRRRPDSVALPQTLFLLNAAGAVGVGLLRWLAVGQPPLYMLLAVSSALLLASAVIRTILRPPSSYPVGLSTSDVVMLGGYEQPMILATTAVAIAIVDGFSGAAVNVAWLLEGELLFLAGLFSRQRVLRYLAAPVLLLAMGKLFLVDMNEIAPTTFAGLKMGSTTPIALLTGGLFYFNRFLLMRVHRAPWRWYYSAAAMVIAGVVVYQEVPQMYAGLAYLAFAALLLELGLHRRLSDLRLQSYLVAAASAIAYIAVNFTGVIGVEPAEPWATYGLGALIAYAAAVRLHRLPVRRLKPFEQILVRAVAFAIGTVLVAVLLWAVLPVPLVALGWGAVALVLLELGSTVSLPVLRLHAGVLLIAAFGRLFMANFTLLGDTAGVSHRLITVAPFLLLYYYVSARLRTPAGSEPARAWEETLARLFFYAPALLAVVLLRFELGRTLAVVGWALLGPVLLWVGTKRDNRDLRWQSYAIAILIFARCWATNFYIPGFLGEIPIRPVIGTIVIISLFTGHLMSPRHPLPEPWRGPWLLGGLAAFELHARDIYAVLAVVLLAALLYYESSISLLTVSWAVEGAVLLVLGFFMRERILRLLGLLLLAICIFKVFLYDLRELEAVYRIISFIGLGLLLLGVSLIYTRYRDQIKRLL